MQKKHMYIYIYIVLSFEYASKFFPHFFASKLFRPSSSVPDLRENLEVRLAPKGRMAAEHDEKHHAQRPNVHLKKSGSLLEKFQSFICHFYVIYVCFIHIYMFYVRNYVKIMWKKCDIEKTLHLLQYSALSSVFILFSSMFACLLLFLLQSFAMQCSSCAFCLRLPFAYPGAPGASAFSVYGSIFRLRISLAT